MNAGPRAMLTQRHFAFPERSRKMLQQPDHLHFYRNADIKNPRLFGPGMFIVEIYSTFSATGVVEVKGEVNAAVSRLKRQFH